MENEQQYLIPDDDGTRRNVDFARSTLFGPPKINLAKHL